MGSANRIAIIFLSTLVPVGLASCGESSPTAPTPVGPLTPGAYRLTLSSLGATSGCSGGNRPDIGTVGNVILDLQIQAEGPEWIGRPEKPGTGDFEMRLRTREDQLTVSGTMRGHGEHFFNSVVNQGTVDVGQSATVEARLIIGPPLRIAGSASGEIVYDRPIVGRVTCTSALWLLERGPN
jgi:hypothetical protein